MKPTYTSVQRVGLYLFSSSDLSRRRSPSPVRPCSPGAPYPRKAVGKTKLRASQLHSPSPYACPCPRRDHGPSANRSAPRRPCKPPGSSICFSIFETGRVPPQPCQISPRRPWATPTWRSVITCPRTRPGTQPRPRPGTCKPAQGSGRTTRPLPGCRAGGQPQPPQRSAPSRERDRHPQRVP